MKQDCIKNEGNGDIMFTACSISIAHNTGVSNKIVRIEPSHKKEGKRGTAHQFSATQTTVHFTRNNTGSHVHIRKTSTLAVGIFMLNCVSLLMFFP